MNLNKLSRGLSKFKEETGDMGQELIGKWTLEVELQMDQGIQVITLVTTQTIELCSGSNHIQATNVRLKVRQPKE
jgi:hypothetical protein